MSLFHLLKRPQKQIIELSLVTEAIHSVCPLQRKHLSELPFAIRDLSRMLTQERSLVQQSYWSSPRFLAAYLHYFLPWNLHRLAWLLPQLSLQPPPNGQVVDLGSGPLTLPIALWCTQPKLRTIPLEFTCYDLSNQPMEIGRRILDRLQGSEGKWRIRCERASVDAAINTFPRKVDLLLAGNVLNELTAAKNGTLEGRFSSLMSAVAKKMAPRGKVLLVEPGTRLGGKVISLARKGALQNGFTALAPCPHNGPCPMLEQQTYQQAAPEYSGWCHFVCPADGIEPDLAELTKRAKLEKASLAVSCLLLTASNDDQLAPKRASAAFATELDELEALYQDILNDNFTDTEVREKPSQAGAENILPTKDLLDVRVISDLIRIPQFEEPARYGCSSAGLVLVKDARGFYPGAGIVVRPTHDVSGELLRDRKSSALFVEAKPVNRGKKAVQYKASGIDRKRKHTSRQHQKKKKTT